MNGGLTYVRMWEEGLPAIRRNDIAPEPLPEHGQRRWGVSAILRPPAGSEPAAGLARAAEALGAAGGGRQIAYGPELLHVTLRSIEGYRGVVAPDDPAVVHYEEVIRAATREISRLEVRFRGVAPMASGVVAQGWPVDDTLARVRGVAHRRLHAAAPVAGPETRRPRDLAHATLLLFREPLEDPEGMVAELEAWRDVDFGTARFDHIEIVRLERDADSARIVPLRVVSLGG
jgi:hypothetical protein